MKSTHAVLLNVLLSLSTFACTAPIDSEETGQANQRAIVSPSVAQQAYSVIAGVDYLPFHYAKDGCFARAFVMSMELAAVGIPSSSMVLNGELHPRSDISWRYHIAPLLRVSGQDMIVDPSLAASPVSAEQWVGLSNPNPAAPYGTFYYPGSYLLRDSTVDYDGASPMISSMSQMPRFQSRDINDAYAILDRFLVLENAANVRAKRARLQNGIRELTSKLTPMGMVE